MAGRSDSPPNPPLGGSAPLRGATPAPGALRMQARSRRQELAGVRLRRMLLTRDVWLPATTCVRASMGGRWRPVERTQGMCTEVGALGGLGSAAVMGLPLEETRGTPHRRQRVSVTGANPRQNLCASAPLRETPHRSPAGVGLQRPTPVRISAPLRLCARRLTDTATTASAGTPPGRPSPRRTGCPGGPSRGPARARRAAFRPSRRGGMARCRTGPEGSGC